MKSILRGSFLSITLLVSQSSFALTVGEKNIKHKKVQEIITTITASHQLTDTAQLLALLSELKDAQLNLAALKAIIGSITPDNAGHSEEALRVQLTSAISEFDTIKAQLKAAEEELASAQDDLRKNQASQKRTQNELKKQREHVKQLEAELAQAQAALQTPAQETSAHLSDTTPSEDAASEQEPTPDSHDSVTA